MKFHGIMAQEVMRIGSNGSLGIGRALRGPAHVDAWQEIHKLAETNPAVKIALDKLMTVYHLSKDHGNNKT